MAAHRLQQSTVENGASSQKAERSIAAIESVLQILNAQMKEGQEHWAKEITNLRSEVSSTVDKAVKGNQGTNCLDNGCAPRAGRKCRRRRKAARLSH